SGELKRTLQWRHGVVRSVAISPDGRFALAGSNPTAGYDNTDMLWDLGSGRLIRGFAREHGWGGPIGFSPDSKFAVLGFYDPKEIKSQFLVIWDLASAREVTRLPVPSAFVIMPDSKSLLAAHRDGKVRRWNLTTGKEAWSVVVDPQGRFGFFAFSHDGELGVWARGSDEVDIEREVVW